MAYTMLSTYIELHYEPLCGPSFEALCTMLWPDPVDRGHPLYYCIAVLVFRSRVPTMCQHHTQSGHSRIHPLLNSAKNICCSKKYLLWSTAADRCKVNNRKAILRGRRAATASIIPEAVSGSRRRKILPILSRSHHRHRQGPAAAILPRLWWPWQLDFNILSGRLLDCCCLTGAGCYNCRYLHNIYTGI